MHDTIQRARWRGRRRGPTGLALAALATLALASPARAVDPIYNKEQLKKRHLEVKKRAEEARDERRWYFDALFEWHFKVVNDTVTDDGQGGFTPYRGEQSDSSRGQMSGLNDFYEVLYLRANYDLPELGPIPELGRLSLRVNFLLAHMVDESENNLQFGDIRLYFSRGFSFSIADQAFGGRFYVYWTFPTSRLSRRQSNISRPTAILALSKKLPLGFTVFARPYLRYNWNRYAQYYSEDPDSCRTFEQELIPGEDPITTGTCGGKPNDKWLVGYELQAIYNLWIHKPVNIGLTFGQYGISKYAAADGDGQYWNYGYYWELFAGYDLPWTKPVDLSTYLTLSHVRDPVFEGDGTPRYDLFDRDHTELYLSIAAKY